MSISDVFIKEWTVDDLLEEYKLDFERAISEIEKSESDLVMVQFPDGLKQYATAVVDYLGEKTGKEFIIYFGTCFGACDTPKGFDDLGIDLVVQFGHNSLQPSYLT